MNALRRIRHAMDARQSTPRERFWSARRKMNAALLAWLATQPPRDDVETELTGTVNCLWQIAGMAQPDA